MVRWFRSVGALLLVLASVGVGSAQASAPTAAPAQQRDPLLAQLERAAGGEARVSYHSATGKLSFVGTSAGKPIARAAGLSATALPEDAARGFLASYGSLFGIENQARDLALMRAETIGGRSFVRFQQRYQGVPILAGELVVQTDGQGDVFSAGGEALPSLALSVKPAIDASAAAQAARDQIAKQYDVAASSLTVAAPALWVYNPTLLGGPGAPVSSLVWRTEVRGTSQGVVFRELVLVDARKGEIALHFNEVAEAKERHVCDDENEVDPDGDETNNCTPDKYVRSEGQPASSVDDVNLAYTYSGDTYDFYKNNFNRDSLDNQGLPLISLVRYCPAVTACPYGNAFWDGQQMTYGDGYATADDVVGHELSHGFTDFSSDLFYYFQSGAINEAMSDIFGELIDLGNGKGNDSASVRWELGEDLPAEIGVIRDMQDPPSLGQPDKMSSEFYVADKSLGDNGGVHTNSGVANKALYLLVDGDTFNGQTVTGIGTAKSAQIFYRVNNNLLTSGSDYQDLANALRASCSSLVGTAGINANDCAQVEKVILATEMDQVPANAPAYDAPVCEPGQTATPVFSDNLENPASGNWTSGPVNGTVNVWSYPQNSDLLSLIAGSSYATSGKTHFFGADFDPTATSQGYFNADSDSAITQAKDVAIPANAFMHFRHSYDFSRIGARNFSGGVVEYSTDAGKSWSDAGSLFTANGYNTSIYRGFGNPLEGRKAFGDLSYGYISSRANLAALSGKNARFRFRIGTTEAISSIGWFIDDISIVTCSGTATNSAPRATAKSTLTVVTGEPAAKAEVATVSDVQDTAASLQVSVVNPPAGLNVRLTNDSGIITASVVGLCTLAPDAKPYDVTIKVRDSGGLESTTTFTVNVEPAGQRIKDPSFEEGDPSFVWDAGVLGEDGAYLCSVDFCVTNATTGPRTGNWWARFGSPVGVAATGYVSQTISLIGNGGTLEFYVKFGSHSGAGASDYVKLFVDNTEVWSVTDADTTYDGTEFKKVTVNLTGVTAGRHVLSFRENNVKGTLPFRVHIDDVRLINTPNGCVGLYPRLTLPIIRR